jgi:hypothetical protein
MQAKFKRSARTICRLLTVKFGPAEGPIAKAWDIREIH